MQEHASSNSSWDNDSAAPLLPHKLGHSQPGTVDRESGRLAELALRLLHRLKKEKGEDQLRTKLGQRMGPLSLLLASWCASNCRRVRREIAEDVGYGATRSILATPPLQKSMGDFRQARVNRGDIRETGGRQRCRPRQGTILSACQLMARGWPRWDARWRVVCMACGTTIS